MSYQCDICSNELQDESQGTFFNQNLVLTSRYFWKFLITEGPPMGRLDEEEKLGLFLLRCVRDDPAGYTVCDKCRDNLSSDIQIAENNNAERFCKSIPSGQVDKLAIGQIAAIVWEEVNGSLPSFTRLIQEITPKKKWWQFWKRGNGWNKSEPFENENKNDVSNFSKQPKDLSGKTKKCINCSATVPKDAMQCSECSCQRYIWE